MEKNDYVQIIARAQNTLRTLILAGFEVDQAMKERLLSVYEELVAGKYVESISLIPFGEDKMLSIGEYSKLRDLAAGGQKIAVIKEIRGMTGLGLKEAKDLAEKMFFPLTPERWG